MEAVIFDMDGVVVDSETYWHRHTRPVLEQAIEEDVDGAAVLQEVTGMNYREIYDHVAERHEVTMTKDEFVAAYNRIAEDVYAAVALMDGFHDLIASIRDRELKTALASSSPRKWITIVLDRFTLDDAFDVVVSADNIDGGSKPAPDIFLHTAERLDVAPYDCVVVEDSANGVTAAKRAGMRAIGFHPAGNDQELDDADVVVTGPDELRDALPV